MSTQAPSPTSPDGQFLTRVTAEPHGCQCLQCCVARASGEKAHDSDCAVHNAPAEIVGPCDCREPQGWQPIDSAPKDADVLLLFQRSDGVFPGWWDDERILGTPLHACMEDAANPARAALLPTATWFLDAAAGALLKHPR